MGRACRLVGIQVAMMVTERGFPASAEAGWLRASADGVVLARKSTFLGQHHPVRSSKVASRYFFEAPNDTFSHPTRPKPSATLPRATRYANSAPSRNTDPRRRRQTR